MCIWGVVWNDFSRSRRCRLTKLSYPLGVLVTSMPKSKSKENLKAKVESSNESSNEDGQLTVPTNGCPLIRYGLCDYVAPNSGGLNLHKYNAHPDLFGKAASNGSAASSAPPAAQPGSPSVEMITLPKAIAEDIGLLRKDPLVGSSIPDEFTVLKEQNAKEALIKSISASRIATEKNETELQKLRSANEPKEVDQYERESLM